MDVLSRINQLLIHTITILEQKRYIEYEKNIDAIIHLLKYAIQNSSNPNDSKVIDSINDSIIDLGISVSDRGFVAESIELVHRLINVSKEVKSDYDKEFKPDIYDLIVRIIKSVSNQNDTNTINRVEEFLHKIDDWEEESHYRNLTYYHSLFYNHLNKNKLIEQNERTSLINSLIRRIVSRINYGKDDKVLLYKRVVYILIKNFIDNYNRQQFLTIMRELYNTNKYSMKEQVYEIFVVVSIYIYYAAFKEKNFNSTFQDQIKQLLNYKAEEKRLSQEEFNLRDIILNSYGDFWGYYNTAKEELVRNGWEYIPYYDAKWMHIEGNLREFYVFYTFLFQDPYQFNLSSLHNLHSEELRLLAEYFGDNYQLKTEYHENLIAFFRWFYPNKEIDEQYIVMKDFIGIHILNGYKQTVFQELLSYNEETERIEQNQHSLITSLREFIKQSPFYKLNNPLLAPDLVSKGYTIHASTFVSIGFLADKVQIFGFDINELMLGEMEDGILRKLLPSLKKVEFHYNNPSKIKKLFDSIDELESSQLNINSFIKDLNNQTILSHFESKESTDQLNSFEEKLEYLGQLSTHRNALYLDSEKLNIKFHDCLIEFRDVGYEDILRELEECRITDQRYKINTTNDIYIELNENEAKEYFKNKYKILEVKMKVEIISDDNVGVVLQYV
jgi:hypothetical protein